MYFWNPRKSLIKTIKHKTRQFRNLEGMRIQPGSIFAHVRNKGGRFENAKERNSARTLSYERMSLLAR